MRIVGWLHQYNPTGIGVGGGAVVWQEGFCFEVMMALLAPTLVMKGCGCIHLVYIAVQHRRRRPCCLSPLVLIYVVTFI